MSANQNPKSVQEGTEFHNRVPPSEPLTRKGHAPGVLVGNERVPEFHAETHPPGTAPRESTFQPRPTGEILPSAEGEATTSAADTLTGSTSEELYKGMGKPLQGQENRELKGAHLRKRKKEREGLAGVGAGDVEIHGAHAERMEGAHQRSTEGGEGGAEDQIPVSAEEVASERKVPHRAYDYTQSS
ncbi:hypothetical protein F5Y16DRAFT_364673 [Xylariaceae sp. FL0255]|nr:hypothetical protein F5Y16DRAFT_364673 [Xylariaceae sp. FL0255]